MEEYRDDKTILIEEDENVLVSVFDDNIMVDIVNYGTGRYGYEYNPSDPSDINRLDVEVYVKNSDGYFISGKRGMYFSTYLPATADKDYLVDEACRMHLAYKKAILDYDNYKSNPRCEEILDKLREEFEMVGYGLNYEEMDEIDL